MDPSLPFYYGPTFGYDGWHDKRLRVDWQDRQDRGGVNESNPRSYNNTHCHSDWLYSEVSNNDMPKYVFAFCVANSMFCTKVPQAAIRKLRAGPTCRYAGKRSVGWNGTG